jgi:hypothetical protein
MVVYQLHFRKDTAKNLFLTKEILLTLEKLRVRVDEDLSVSLETYRVI